MPLAAVRVSVPERPVFSRWMNLFQYKMNIFNMDEFIAIQNENFQHGWIYSNTKWKFSTWMNLLQYKMQIFNMDEFIAIQTENFQHGWIYSNTKWKFSTWMNLLQYKMKIFNTDEFIAIQNENFQHGWIYCNTNWRYNESFMSSPTSLWVRRGELIYIHAEKETRKNGGRTVRNKL